MSQGVLERLFGSEIRVRLLRLFLMNPNEAFDLQTVVVRSRAKKTFVARELKLLLDIHYIRKAMRPVTIQRKKGKAEHKKIPGFQLDREFPFLNELAELLASSAPFARERFMNNMRGKGKVNVVIIAGKLLGYETEHVDVFIAGDALKKTKIERLLTSIEMELGKELVYALMPTREFEYRFGMHDRFIKELLNNPHEVLVNKIGITLPSVPQENQSSQGRLAQR